MPSLGLNRNPFVWPARRPGIDRSHPAIGKVQSSGSNATAFLFSAVCNGQGFTNLFNSTTAKNGANTGSGGAYGFGQDPVIGPFAGFNISGSIGGTQHFDWTPIGSGLNGTQPYIFAGIVRPNASITGYGSIIQLIDASFGLYVNNNVFEIYDGGDVSSGISVTSRTPYFVAASVGASTTLFAVTNLQTGQIRTASIAHTLAVNTPTSIRVGGDGGAEYFLGPIHCVMIAQGVTLSAAQLRAWAQNPFGFWYPSQAIEFATLAGGVAAAPALGLPAPPALPKGLHVGPMGMYVKPFTSALPTQPTGVSVQGGTLPFMGVG